MGDFLAALLSSKASSTFVMVLRFPILFIHIYTNIFYRNLSNLANVRISLGGDYHLPVLRSMGIRVRLGAHHKPV